MCVNIAAHFAGRLRAYLRTQPDRGSEALREERQVGQHEDLPVIIAMKLIDFSLASPTGLQAYDYKRESVRCRRRYQTAEGRGFGRKRRRMLHICNRFATGLSS